MVKYPRPPPYPPPHVFSKATIDDRKTVALWIKMMYVRDKIRIMHAANSASDLSDIFFLLLEADIKTLLRHGIDDVFD